MEKINIAQEKYVIPSTNRKEEVLKERLLHLFPNYKDLKIEVSLGNKSIWGL